MDVAGLENAQRHRDNNSGRSNGSAIFGDDDAAIAAILDALRYRLVQDGYPFSKGLDEPPIASCTHDSLEGAGNEEQTAG